MTDPPPEPAGAPAAPGERRGRVAGGQPWWRTSIVSGSVAALVVAAGGQGIALAVWVAGGPGSPTTSPRLGWLYTSLFNGVPLDLELRDLRVLSGSTGSFSGTLGVALLTGTAAVLVACFLAGRRTARGAATRWAGVLRGASIAVPYAILAGLVSALVEVTILLVPGEPADGSVLVRPAMPGAFVWPLLIGAIGGMAGGYASWRGAPGRARRGMRIEAAVVGGWWMLVAGLSYSLVGVVALAILHPDATSAYVRRVTSAGPGVGALVAGHQLLALPNQAMFVLAPAMGACDTVRGERGDLDALCLRRVPQRLDASLLSPDSGPRPNVGDAPATFWLLVLTPAAAAVSGGMVAARRLGGTRTRAAVVGAGAGLVFALLCGITAFLASVRASGELLAGAATWIGPRPVATALVAIPWGVVGGAIGGSVGAGRSATGRRTGRRGTTGRRARSPGDGPSAAPSARST